jgi:hypothetical protein
MDNGQTFCRGKRPGRESDHSAPTSAEVQMGGAISLLQHTPSWCAQGLHFLSGFRNKTARTCRNRSAVRAFL